MPKYFAPALLLALAPGALAPAHADVADSLTYQDYELSVANGSDVDALFENGPVMHGNGEPALSGLQWDIRWRFGMLGSGASACRISSSKVTLKAEIMLPRFTGAQPRQAAQLERLAASLKAHELGHYQQAQEAAALIDTSLSGMKSVQGCETLALAANERAEGVLEQLRALHERYDGLTQNGKAQSADTKPLKLEVPTAAPAPAEAEPAQPATVDKDGWIGIDIGQGHLRFPVRLNGVDAIAMLDSGAEMNGISERFAEAHRSELIFGERIRLQGVFGTEEKQLVGGVKVGLLGTELELSNLTPAELGSADLLLGGAFIRSFIVQIDYPKQRLRLLPHKAIDWDKIPGVKMRAEKGSTLPAVSVSVQPGEEIWLTLDTGNAGGLFMRRSAAEKYGWTKQHPTEQHLAVGANGVGAVESLRIPYFKIGPYELENVLVTIPGEGQSSNVGQPGSGSLQRWGARGKGLMGYDVLKHFVVTMDVKNMKMHLAQPETMR